MMTVPRWASCVAGWPGSGCGWARLAEFAAGTADQWRQQQAEHIEQALAGLDERLTEDLRAGLDAVRDAAAELLGLTLTVPGPGRRCTTNWPRASRHSATCSPCWPEPPPPGQAATSPPRAADPARL